MLTPKYPPADTYTAPALPPAGGQPTAPAPVPVSYVQPPVPAPNSTRPVVQLTPGSVATLVVGGTAVVLVVGVVLVSMLLAVAITAVSVAVVAVVLRSLLTDSRKAR